MAHIATADILHSMKHPEKETKHTHVEHDNSKSDSSSADMEKTASHGAGYDMDGIPMDDGKYRVTAKTWAVVITLAMSYGISFWPVPFFSTIQSQIATEFGQPELSTWITSVYSAAGTISMMVCGANSDLFGRRYFILLGNVLVFVGSVLGATSHSMNQSIAAHTLIGFGAGNCQLAAFALPELLPNKWRHFAVVIADGMIFFTVIVGPVTARIAILHGDSWRWGYWATVILIAISFAILAAFYHPPKHPRGIPWDQALRQLDYVGMVSFTAAAAMILSGMVFVQYLPSTNPKVIGLLVAGFVLLIFFGLWETLAPLKQPLAPTRLFIHNKGRTLTAPFVVGFVVTMFYYGTNILWPTMFGFYFVNTATPFHIVLLLATVQGFGIFTGAMILSFGGTHFQHWKWQMTIPIAIMTFFGGMLAYVKPGQEGMGIAFAYLSATGYGYAQYLSIAYIQFGADQVELGIAGGLAGVARYAGGAVAVTMYAAILLNTQASAAMTGVPAAAEAAGASPAVAKAVAAAIPLGTAALEKVQGLTTAIATAAGAAYVESWVKAVQNVALTSMAFGVVAVIATLFLEDIGPKMTNKIEIYLENDVQADKNKENRPILHTRDPNASIKRFVDRQEDAVRVEWSQQSEEDEDLARGDRRSRLGKRIRKDDDEVSDEEAFQEDQRIFDRNSGKAVVGASQTIPTPSQNSRSAEKRLRSRSPEQVDEQETTLKLLNARRERERRERELQEQNLQASAQAAGDNDESDNEIPPSSYLDVNRTAKAITARFKPPKIQKRTPWSLLETEWLIEMIARHGCHWSEILKLADGILDASRGQVSLKDKARNIKVDYLKSDTDLPLGFDGVALGMKEIEKVKSTGRNPYRKEGETPGHESIDIDGVTI